MHGFVKRHGAAFATAAALVLAGTAAHAGTASFEVLARDNSTAFSSRDAAPLDTGLTFTAGSLLHITASGSWNGGGGCPSVGPTGANCFGNDPVTGFNYFSLVGRVGDGAYFKVGDAYDGTANASGHLFLAFLDSDSFNNSGSVTAVVTTVPEPATWALTLAGILALRMRSLRRG